MGAQLISEDERQDFLNGVTELGFEAGQFQVIGGARADKPIGGGIQALHQEVIVHRAKTNVRRVYKGGHGQAWAAVALDEVKAGLFGPK